VTIVRASDWDRYANVEKRRQDKPAFIIRVHVRKLRMCLALLFPRVRIDGVF